MVFSSVIRKDSITGLIDIYIGPMMRFKIYLRVLPSSFLNIHWSLIVNIFRLFSLIANRFFVGRVCSVVSTETPTTTSKILLASHSHLMHVGNI